jgi:hypothetical protein
MMSDYEERELDREEASQRFDEETLRLEDEADTEYGRDTALNRVPVACIVNGHDYQMNRFSLTFCTKCGQDEYDDRGQL